MVKCETLSAPPTYVSRLNQPSLVVWKLFHPYCNGAPSPCRNPPTSVPAVTRVVDVVKSLGAGVFTDGGGGS